MLFSLAKRYRNPLTFLMILTCLIMLSSLVGSPTASAHGGLAFVRLVRAIETGDLGIPNPAGLAFSPAAISSHAGRAPKLTQPPAAASVVTEVRVAASSDDAEESASGNMYLTSSDLELAYDGSDQTVGMRFNGVDIPQGATILSAYIQFQVDETTTEETALVIQGEAADNASIFASISGNISSRATTAATASWSPVPWTTEGEAGPGQQTPDLAPVIQEVVNRSGWTSGNSLVVIITGTGKRVAEAYDGDQAGAPLLHVEYVPGMANQAPTVMISSPADGETFNVGEVISFTGTAGDAEDGDLTAALLWTSDLDGAIGTGGSFTRSDLSLGVQAIAATAIDSGGLVGTDQISITVISPGGNLPPVVSAGLGQTIGLFDNAILEGTVSDDGLPDPPGVITTTWSVVSGTGVVTFADASAVDTLASFRAAGAYVLELAADDGELIASDQVTISVISTPIIRVPQDQPTIQAGIDVAQDGDLVLVSPGTYAESITISGKSITLASEFYATQDSSFIEQTAIDGGGNTVITVDSSVGPDVKIIGFTIRNGDDGIHAYSKLHILNNHFVGNGDAIDYEDGSGGICRNNVFENNSDDAVDLDGSTEVMIEKNIIRDNGDDGIEVRLHEYSGPTLNIIIRGNTIVGSEEDGIQLIGYYIVSDRVIRIERNLIQGSAMVGLGLMDNEETVEDFRAASIPERIYVFNNTFVDNPYGITGGDNLIALNNLFVNSADIALKEVDSGSMAAYNLFWGNGTHNQGSNIEDATTLYADPLLNSKYHLQAGSPGIDAGTAYFEWGGETVLDVPSSAYSGAAPELGAYESGLNQPPIVEAGPDQTVMLLQSAILDGTVTDDGLPDPPGVITTTWSMVRGPGTVSFGDANAVDTTASFSTDGVYVLRLRAEDGELTDSDELTITVAFRFVSWADTKSALDELASLSNQAVLLNPVFTIYEGDLESDGFTLSGMDAWKEAMNGATGNGMFDKTLPVRGNHDANDTAGWQSYYDIQSTALSLGATNYNALNEDLTYSFDFGNSHFIGVDVLGDADNLTSEQVNWIDTDLSAAEGRGLTHAFVYFHGPIYCVDGHCSCTTRTCSLDPIVMSLIDVFNKHPIVSATFHGHEHTHAYVHIDDTRIPEASHPFEEFITGSAGAGPNPCIPERIDYCLPSYGFVTVDVSGNSFAVDFYELGTTSPVTTMAFTKLVNQAPVVDAGLDQAISLLESAALDGTVTDDGLPDPPGVITTTWSVVSGSGVVTFTDAYTVDTTADFSAAGVYVLRLTAEDGELTASDELTVSVNPTLPGNTAPTVVISAPADGATFDAGEVITFTAVAGDAQDGDVTAGLSWTSDLDGAIGTGGSFTATLGVGVHVITATVADSGGLSGSDQITLTVNAANMAPTVVISAPADRTTFDVGEIITFTGTASDAEDGDVTVGLSWTSDLDGAIGTGGSFARSDLSVGPHTITAVVTDTSGLTASDQETITVNLTSGLIIRVPQEQSTIQAGIDVAQDGDLVLVSPGIYTESITITGKSITLASEYYTTQEPSFIEQTIIDGGGSTVITADASAGPDVKIIGFTIRNGDDGIHPYSKLHILNNHFVGNGDAIDYEDGGGGICRNNVFENNSDDAVDLDGSTEVTVEDNIIRDNGDDGIEVRLHEYSGPMLNIIIRGNTIMGSGEDGIQLIDYPDVSDRVIRIERNLIQGSAMVGLGLMDNGDTVEDFRAASIPERIYVFNNTFVDNPYSITGGDNLIALNNLFVNSADIALKAVDGDSVAAYNLFWNNGTHNQGSNVDETTTLYVDPLLDSDYHLQAGSPGIDAGTAYFEGGGETVLDMPSSAYSGAAPDLGMHESSFVWLPIILRTTSE